MSFRFQPPLVWRVLVTSNNVLWADPSPETLIDRETNDGILFSKGKTEMTRKPTLLNGRVNSTSGQVPHNGQTFASQVQNMETSSFKFNARTVPDREPDNNRSEQQKPTPVIDSKHHYDFVVVGNGNAGRSAVATLRKQCQAASIAVIDPLRCPTEHAKHHHHDTGSDVKGIDYFPASVVKFDPITRTIQFRLNPSSPVKTSNEQDLANDAVTNPTTTTTALLYRHSILIATGSRGAPPPHYLFDESALPRILELRPTLAVDAPATTPSSSIPRPLFGPLHVRETVLTAASLGHRVAILGSGWEAVELAVAASKQQNSRRKSKEATTTLIFGTKGPLAHAIPQYLSTAVAGRLKSKNRINIMSRSLIRYVGSDQNNVANELSDLQLQIFTAKSYDLLDTKRVAVDWVVVAPEVGGPMGTASVPTTDIPPHLEPASEGRSWYRTWSSLTTKPNLGDLPYSKTSAGAVSLVACYTDDGRIAVDGELHAGSRVYAAGSVAKYPNMLTGHADVAGVGFEDGTQAGHVAAMNMAQEYSSSSNTGQNRHGIQFFGGGFKSQGNNSYSIAKTFFKDPIPVWRSDINSITIGSSSEHYKSGGGGVSTLESIGIKALCIGSCDAERFATQAFWWTNKSKKAVLDVLQTDAKVTDRKNISTGLSAKPVYGVGIVFYVDKAGKIQGVMFWGLPFAKADKRVKDVLVDKSKEIIATNGGCSSVVTEEERISFHNFLLQSSRLLVVSAHMKGNLASGNISDEYEERLERLAAQLPRPLFRYTDLRPASVRNVRVLQRKDGNARGVLGEDLFSKHEGLPETPPGEFPQFNSIVEPSANSGDTKSQAMLNWSVWEWYQRRWEENEDRARPPKEEILWLRKGDEAKSIASSEVYNEGIKRAMGIARDQGFR